MSERPRYRVATQVGHLGRDPRRFLGAVNTPVFRASTILFSNVAELEQAARGQYDGLSYGLHGLPTVTDLAQALAALEGADDALLVPSGLTATTFPLLAMFRRVIAGRALCRATSSMSASPCVATISTCAGGARKSVLVTCSR